MNSVMRVLGAAGDAETTWDPTDPPSVEKARQAFEAYRKGGLLTFSVSEPGAEATLVRAFDPAASEIVVTRPLVGG